MLSSCSFARINASIGLGAWEPSGSLGGDTEIGGTNAQCFSGLGAFVSEGSATVRLQRSAKRRAGRTPNRSADCNDNSYRGNRPLIAQWEVEVSSPPDSNGPWERKS